MSRSLLLYMPIRNLMITILSTAWKHIQYEIVTHTYIINMLCLPAYIWLYKHESVDGKLYEINVYNLFLGFFCQLIIWVFFCSCPIGYRIVVLCLTLSLIQTTTTYIHWKFDDMICTRRDAKHAYMLMTNHILYVQKKKYIEI